MFDSSALSVEGESPVNNVISQEVATFPYPIQSLCSGLWVEKSICKDSHICLVVVFLGGIDSRGTIRFYSVSPTSELTLFGEYQHSSSLGYGLEESWTLLRLAPSGERVPAFVCCDVVLVTSWSFTDNQHLFFKVYISSSQGLHDKCYTRCLLEGWYVYRSLWRSSISAVLCSFRLREYAC